MRRIVTIVLMALTALTISVGTASSAFAHSGSVGAITPMGGCCRG
jgi:hypothetical protein